MIVWDFISRIVEFGLQIYQLKNPKSKIRNGEVPWSLSIAEVRPPTLVPLKEIGLQGIRSVRNDDDGDQEAQLSTDEQVRVHLESSTT